MELTIDTKQLRTRCLMKEDDFKSLGTVVRTQSSGYSRTYWKWDKEKKSGSNVTEQVTGRESFYIYIDNGAKVLGVAHLDTVKQVKDNWTFQKATLGDNNRKRSIIWNAQLDDRLGVYILLDMLAPFIGGQYDILLTTDEEIGASTASAFVPPEGKDYNWIFQFDRRGDDTVMYQYESPEWRKTIATHFTPGTGSFSDIGKLEHLGVKGMNIGCGYHDEHHALCYMVREETINQVYRFLKFFDEFKDVKFTHTKSAARYTSRGYNQFGWDGEDWGDGGYYASGATSAGTRDATKPIQLPSPTNSTSVSDIPVKGMSRNTKLYDANYYSKERYEDKDPYNWIDLPGITMKEIMFQYPVNLGLPEHPVNTIRVFTNPFTKIEACYCSNCTSLEPIQDLFWSEDATPICATCGMALQHSATLYTNPPDRIAEKDVVFIGQLGLDNDHIEWLNEGGSLRVNGNTITRSLVNVSEELRAKRHWCDLCNQPEWRPRIVTFHKAGTNNKADSTNVCRWCFEKSSDPDGIYDDKTSDDVG